MRCRNLQPLAEAAIELAARIISLIVADALSKW